MPGWSNGRLDCFKSNCRKAYGFKSHSRHHLERINMKYEKDVAGHPDDVLLCVNDLKINFTKWYPKILKYIVKLMKESQSNRFIAGMMGLPREITVYNGGVKCDVLVGPCSCGAFHYVERQGKVFKRL